MALKIRLTRGGAKKKPFYRLVLAENTSPRDGKFQEILGTYNPLVSKESEGYLNVSGERIKYWLSKGAKATDRVARILGKIGVMEKFEYSNTPKKSAPKEKAVERAKEKVAKAEKQKEADCTSKKR